MIRTMIPTLILGVVLAAGKSGAAEGVDEARKASVKRGLAWLCKNQGQNGSWGAQYSVAVTSFAALAHLAASEEPFEGEGGKSL